MVERVEIARRMLAIKDQAVKPGKGQNFRGCRTAEEKPTGTEQTPFIERTAQVVRWITVSGEMPFHARMDAPSLAIRSKSKFY